MSNYKNPINKEDIIISLKNAETHNEVIKIINSVFPTWILGCSKKYSDDYQHFTTNWNMVCEKINCQPLDIIIVDELIHDNDEYSLCFMFCELLTLFGHSIRRKEEFFECKYCSSIIPNEQIYNKLKEAKVMVPLSWSMKCMKC